MAAARAVMQPDALAELLGVGVASLAAPARRATEVLAVRLAEPEAAVREPPSPTACAVAFEIGEEEAPDSPLEVRVRIG